MHFLCFYSASFILALHLFYFLQKITSADDIRTLNEIGSVSCVIQLHYPNYIQLDDLNNLEVCPHLTQLHMTVNV